MPPKKRRATNKATGDTGQDSVSDSSTTRRNEYQSKTVADLRNLCSQLGLSITGTKSVLIDRLLEHDEGLQAATPAKLQKQDSVNTKIKKAFQDLKSQAKAKTNFKVDAHCSLSATVHEDFSCMLNQTNINQNNNKFYVIQLLKNAMNASYSVFTRWGRVGEVGQQSVTNAATVDQAVRDFKKKFKDKTKNDWENRDQFVPHSGKYTLLEMDDDDEEDGEEGNSQFINKKNAPLSKQLVDGKIYAPCTLDDVTMQLVELIFDDNTFRDSMQAMDLDVKKMPLGKLSKAQIAKGFEVLVDIDQAIKAGSSKAAINELSSKFYTLIPHSFGRQVPPAINTDFLVQKKKDMLIVLSDIELTMSLQKQEKPVRVKGEKLEPHPLDVKYELLHCKLTPLNSTSKEYKIIQTYIDRTGYQYNEKKKVNIWLVDRDREAERFKTHNSIKERKLLWHGTNVAVVAAILSSGLRIMPHSGGRVGKGIYFASEQSKSLGYVGYASNGTGIMFLNEVALGKEHTIIQDDCSLTAAPAGCQCVVARGITEPDPKADTTITLDGKTVVVPQGKPINTKFTNSCFTQSEYLVYKESQARIRYLITFK